MCVSVVQAQGVEAESRIDKIPLPSSSLLERRSARLAPKMSLGSSCKTKTAAYMAPISANGPAPILDGF